MSLSPTKPPRVSDPEQILRGLHPLAMKGGLLLSLSVTLQYVGQWRLFGFVALASFVRYNANGLLSPVLNRRFGPTVTEWCRLAWNLGTMLVIGLGAGWTLLLWIYVPFIMLWFHGLDGWGRARAIVFLVGMDGVALWSGCDPFQPLAFSIIGALGFLLTEKRAELLQQSLEQIIEQREQLSQAQSQLRQLRDRAVEQEKLSSLGMMAAGVAHEINNPMSFVTSNVNALLKDLKQEPALSESLKEYVEEVLPATLDGIKRVNAIVSDLRHFARGDAEVPAEYHLNAEAQAALRIAQGQLNHVDVEVDLGDTGVVVGRPRQLVQVLVNLLVNAGQATQPGGKVRMSTRREEGGVGVEIRDTGAGMTPETMRNLFQPFFTTKPPGMGMGLGLAVAHGIITGQGGRIEVQSEPGKGSCFTLYLPRVATAAPRDASKSPQGPASAVAA
jgi:two-component system, NtrC family, sensor kinase